VTRVLGRVRMLHAMGVDALLVGHLATNKSANANARVELSFGDIVSAVETEVQILAGHHRRSS
jgi:hypothetical protein